MWVMFCSVLLFFLIFFKSTPVDSKSLEENFYHVLIVCVLDSQGMGRIKAGRLRKSLMFPLHALVEVGCRVGGRG